MTSKTFSENAPRLLMVATLDRSLRNFYPHIDACRAAGCRVDIACRISDFGDEIRSHCDRLYDVPFRRFPIHPSNLITFLRLISIMRQHKYDIVHSHTPAGGMIGRAAATAAKIPIRIYMAHGFHFHPEGKWITNIIFSSLERFAGKFLSDWVEVINTEDYRSALSFGIVPQSKLVMIDGTGIDTARFDPRTVLSEERHKVKRELNISDGTKVVGVIAELIPRKRLHDTIRAIEILKREFPKILLIILGSGEQRDKLELFARQCDLVDNVKFLGFRRDLPRLITAMDVFAFSTEQEGLPAALMEAMCMGVPSVATNIRGNRDIIVDGENGILVPLGDSQSLADACRQILRDGSFAKTIANAGRHLIVQKYDTKRTVAQQMAAYVRAIDSAIESGRLKPAVRSVVEQFRI